MGNGNSVASCIAPPPLGALCVCPALPLVLLPLAFVSLLPGVCPPVPPCTFGALVCATFTGAPLAVFACPPCGARAPLILPV